MCWHLQGREEKIRHHWIRCESNDFIAPFFPWSWESNPRALPLRRPPRLLLVHDFFFNGNLPTTPNIFLMSGTYIASKTMIMLSANVVRECRIHENGKFEKSSIIKAFLACRAEKRDSGKGKDQRHGICLEKHMYSNHNIFTLNHFYSPDTA